MSELERAERLVRRANNLRAQTKQMLSDTAALRHRIVVARDRASRNGFSLNAPVPWDDLPPSEKERLERVKASIMGTGTGATKLSGIVSKGASAAMRKGRSMI